MEEKQEREKRVNIALSAEAYSEARLQADESHLACIGTKVRQDIERKYLRDAARRKTREEAAR